MDRFQFAVGEDITMRERLVARFVLPTTLGDTMIEKNTARPQQRGGLAERDLGIDAAEDFNRRVALAESEPEIARGDSGRTCHAGEMA